MLSSSHTLRRMANVLGRGWRISLDHLQINMSKQVVKFPSSHQNTSNSVGRGFQGSFQCPMSRSQLFIAMQKSTAALEGALGLNISVYECSVKTLRKCMAEKSPEEQP